MNTWKSLAVGVVISLVAACGGDGSGGEARQPLANAPRGASTPHAPTADDPSGCGPSSPDDPTASPDPTDPAPAVCPDASDPKVHYLSDDPLVCAAVLFACEGGQTLFSDGCGCGCVDDPSAPPDRCERSTHDACNDDSDCVAGGCGGELCFNPALSDGISTCDCVEPPTKACQCKNHVCAWD